MSFTERDLDTLIDILRETARTEVVPRFRNLSDGERGEKTSAEDLVTVADTAMERAATAAIERAFPGTAVVGEEAVFDDPTRLYRIGEPGRVVILDPIDGTWNFANGNPLFGTIAGVTEDGETVAGAILDPLNNDAVAAIRGGGAWHLAADGRRTRLQVAPGTDLPSLSGFVSTFLFPKERRRDILMAQAPFVRSYSLRCSAFEYRALAEGATHFGLTSHLKPWDHAGGVLIHAEAGGVARLLKDGAPYSPVMREGAMLVAPDDDTWHRVADQFRAAVFGG